MADESVCVGSHQPANSYLNIPALMSAIELTNADAVHPGYGFLSENANFARILEENKINFIGASSKHIEMMGDKIQAKRIAKENGLPVIEGSEGGVKDVSEAKELCKKIKKGDTIMIVEAMKTMNHVPSTSDGVVKEICVEDGHPVEFGQTIIVLE